MEIPDLKRSTAEKKRGYEIKHFHGFDVVLNINYPCKKDRDDILKILSTLPTSPKPRSNNELFRSSGIIYKTWEIDDLMNEDLSRRFFVKTKSVDQGSIDFLLGRDEEDFISPHVSNDFDRKARYAFIGVLSEMSLTKKIKDLVHLKEFQEVAKHYNFVSIEFAEPIMAIVERTSGFKYVIYQYVPEERRFGNNVSNEMVKDFRKLFFKNGISPHDLRESQFLITEDRRLILIDIEAYTEEKPIAE